MTNAIVDDNAEGFLNMVEAINATHEQVELPLIHRFTPGMYIREIFMPAGVIVTSKLHKTEHPFAITKGELLVWTEGEGTIKLSAPYIGITKPGTRRILYIISDTQWATFHCNPENTQDLIALEDRIIQKHENPYLGMDRESIQKLLANKNV